MEEGTGILELLLPEAKPATLGRARRVVTCLRLLVDDGRLRPAEAVALHRGRAQDELERRGRGELRSILEDLLIYHLRAAQGPDSFVDWSTPQRSVQGAWEALDGLRGEWDSAPHVPEPGERALDVARRLLNASQVLGVGREADRWRRFWTARWIHSGQGPAVGEARWRRLLRSVRRAGGSVDEEIACVRGVAECLLERGAVSKARGWLDQHLDLASVDARLGHYLVWSSLLGGDEPHAARLAQELPVQTGCLPRPLAELRELWPAWKTLLKGSVSECAFHGPRVAPELVRSELGASFAAFLRLGPGSEPDLERFEVAPGLADQVQAWFQDRRDCVASREGWEHAVLLQGRAHIRHRFPGQEALRCALDSPRARAVALLPAIGPGGEVVGWIHLEWEHHLVPSLARLESLVRRWLERPAPVRQGVRPLLPEEDPRVSCARAGLRELGMKLAQRRAVVLDCDEETWALAEGGGLQRAATRASALALERCVRWGKGLVYGDGDPRLFLHGGARSGLVVPWCVRERVHGLLCVESSRRRDFDPGDLGRAEVWARAWAPRWRVAQFRAWHLRRFGHDLYLDPIATRFGGRMLELSALGRSRAPLALVGPDGSGRRLLARWAHFEGDRSEEPIEHVSPLDAALGAADRRGGTEVWESIDRLDRALQAELLRALGRSRGPRIVATLEQSLGEAVRAGALLPELAESFGAFEFFVPSLGNRRDEIPGLARHFLTRFAQAEGLRPAQLEDTAVALLWRQSWRGNLRELGDFCHRLAIHHPGERLGEREPMALGETLGRPLLLRLPSRRPDPELVRLALDGTRRASGRLNKTRAALYLGWDPDTLVARMGELGLE